MTRANAEDAVAMLKADHRVVEELFESFEKASGARKGAIAKKICEELMVHSTLEEEIFYPAVRGQVEDDKLDEAYVEHDGAKMLIAEILAGDPEDDFFDAKVMVLAEEIKHHVKEEEKRGEGVFAQAKAAGVDLKALGEVIAARKPEVKKQVEQGTAKLQTRTFKGGAIDRGTPPKFEMPEAAD
jgi:uncharacterized protein (UPF0335 family)